MDLLDRIRLWSSLALAFLLFLQAAFWLAVGVLRLWQGALAEAGLPFLVALVLFAAAAFFYRFGLAARH